MKDLLEKTSKKTLIIGSMFIILIFVIILGGALLYNKLFYNVSYSEIEKILKEAAVEYLKEYDEKLPKNINDSITIPESTLVSANKMKSVDELLKDDNNTCTAEVIVTNINNSYRYNPILDCGEDYKNIKFIDYIKNTVPTVTSKDGLYDLNNELVYRGELINNYLTLSGKIYRIVKFTNNQTVLILTDYSESIIWDDRYNIEKNSNIGINNYDVSRIKEKLNKLYNENTLINDEDKLLVTKHSLKAGKRSKTDNSKNGSTEGSYTIDNQYLSLLPLYDYLNASTDINCTSTFAESCANYNYLAKYNFNWWLATANSENTHQVYKVSDNVMLENASNTAYLRPVIYLTKDAMYVSGDGSKENPYKVR